MQKVQRKRSGEADKSRRSLTEERYRDNRRHEKVDGRSRRPPATYSVKEDVEPRKVGDESESSDTEKSETEEAVLNLLPVEAVLAENMGTEEASSVRESLAEKQQSDLEFGLLVKLCLQSEQRPSIDQLITERPKTEATGSVDRTKEDEELSDTENDTQDECAEKADAEKEITPEGHDWNKMAGPSGTDYVVDDAE